jgi:hypothetical protein
MGINKLAQKISKELDLGMFGIGFASIMIIFFSTFAFGADPNMKTYFWWSPITIWIYAGVLFVLWEWVFIDECITNTWKTLDKDAKVKDYMELKLFTLLAVFLILPISIFILVCAGGLIYMIYSLIKLLIENFLGVMIVAGIILLIYGYFMLNGWIGKKLRERK